MTTVTVATVDDVLRLAAAGRRYELVNGELVEMAPTGFEHGDIELRIGRLLSSHVDRHQLGRVVVGEVLFQLDREGHLARAADVAFVSRERLPLGQSVVGAFLGAPDIAVEVVSPGNTAEEIQQKVGDWLAHGAQIVLLVFGDSRTVVVWRPEGAVLLRADDELALDPVLPGFRCRIAEFFPPRQKAPETQAER